MRTLTSLLLASMLSCSPAPQTTGEVYGANVRVVSWGALDEAVRTVPPQQDLAVLGKTNLQKIHAPEDITKRTLDTILQVRNVTAQNTPLFLAELSIRQAIALDRDIVARWITYPDLSMLQPLQSRNAPLAEYLDLGIGDCTQYTSSFTAVFDVLRSYNPRLRDVIVTDFRLGGKEIRHDWNVIAVPTPAELLVAHVDVTGYDNDDAFAGEEGYHYARGELAFAAGVYNALADRKRALALYSLQIDGMLHTIVEYMENSQVEHDAAYDAALDTTAKLTLLLEDVGLEAYKSQDAKTLHWLRHIAVTMSPTIPGLDRLTYYTAIVEKEQGYPQTAAAIRKILYERFPDSLWTAKLTE